MKKRITVLVLMLALFLQGIASPYLMSELSVVQAAGSGTESDPIQISTVQELKSIANGLDKHYILTSDIVFSAGTYWFPIGTADNPFCGTLNGNGYKIKNLLIDTPYDYAGLFGYVSTATVENLSLENVNITGAQYTGAIAGRYLEGQVKNCKVTGIIKGANLTGGLIGRFGPEVIEGEKSASFENCAVEGTISGISGVGGFAGELRNGSVIKCHNKARVSAHSQAGGFMGTASVSEISQSYNTGAVSIANTGAGAVSEAGGIVGRGGTLSIKECFNLGGISGIYKIGGIAGNTYSVQIENCYNEGSVTGSRTSHNLGVGGIVGAFDKSSSIKYCYSVGTILARGQFGGLVGVCDGEILSSAAMGEKISGYFAGEGTFGRIVGQLNTTGKLSNNIANDDMVIMLGDTTYDIGSRNPRHDNENGFGIDKNRVISNSDYLESIGWDFASIWRLSGEENKYPVLRNVDLNPPVQVISVTSVSLDETAKAMEIGDQLTLQATVLPANASNKNVTWTSSAADIAAVDQSGLVTAKTAGQATITVTTEDGQKKASCVITVNAKPADIPVTEIHLDKTSETLMLNQTLALTATVLPENATNKKVIWSSSNEAVATVDQNGQVKAVGEGFAAIVAISESGIKIAYCNLIVTATPENLALNKKVTASGISGLFVAENAVDGRLDTRWLSPSIEPGQYLEIDFEKLTQINRIKIKESHIRVTSYQLQYYSGTNWHTCYTGTGLGSDFTAVFVGIETSKIRLVVNGVTGKNGVSIAEIEAYYVK